MKRAGARNVFLGLTLAGAVGCAGAEDEASGVVTTKGGALTASYQAESASVAISLQAGNNDVVHSSVTADGMPNIDKFDITQSHTNVYQVENANDIDEGVVETINPGWTGTGYVNINNFSNTFFLHVVSSPIAASVTMTVRYANGTSVARPIKIIVNGVTAGQLAGSPTGSWSTWAAASLPITLQAGNNDIVHSSVTSDGMPNIDKFDLRY